MVAEVLVELKGIDQSFTYQIPEELEKKIKIGIRVLVPFGNKNLEGFIVKILPKKDYDYELKKIIEVIDENPVINNEMLELGKYISQKTLASLISVYQTMLPSALKAKKGFIVKKKYHIYIKLNNKLDNINDYFKTTKQKQIYELVKNGKIIKKELTNISPSVVKTLLDKRVLLELKEEVYRLNDNVIKEKNNIALNDEQKTVIKSVTKSINTFSPCLLHGVTGSGKTEVYMNLIKEVINNKKEAIVLVPEISLTPQLVDTFKRRFGSDIAILHSRLSEGEKYDEWRKIERKEVSIVIGARSAIFAPFTNLGIIIIDEEHSATYKQENNPKYNAIDVAIKRAKTYNIPVVLGSATPSVESYTRAKIGIYHLLELKNRVNNNLPKVYLIDMKEEMKKGNRVLSKLLVDEINETILRQEQVILLLNRRGYSTVTNCQKCGYIDKCPNCDIPLIYHKTSSLMRCHYCGYSKRKLTICPSCQNKQINEYGMGTEKLEKIISETFPKAKTVRMDIDTTTTKGSHERIINDFKNEKYNILIGTQMISKGLDFEKVTLVGVINGDSTLNIPDFRSAERTYQLLSQVAGRAGRSQLKGRVIIQGFNINHYSIQKASNHDYLGFYNKEMKIRDVLKYPPYYNLTLIKISGKDETTIIDESNKIFNYLSKELKKCQILGPSFPNIPKINKIYTMQIIIKYKNTKEIIDTLIFINNKYKNSHKIHLDVDINPIKL